MLIDETTTLSRKTTLIIYIRAVLSDCHKPQTMFFDLFKLESTTADGIYNALIACLHQHGFSDDTINQCVICLATDGASAMMRSHSGVCAKFAEKFQHIVKWHCSSHRLELSVHDTTNEISGVDQFHIFFDKLYSSYR